ncbi:Fumarylacetoacetate hydrolase domain-containing protein [Cavenderia fasciculata]|uniref:Fumarylacetoacetate hydrolase domain-containing protein n=1 Tax=Cavenderia fasciculata TaxID=261658 RepID=F4Q9K4_CACFS|nr:Fumarylacetoacetate hydrolase domain-containing protein [Cavenderia fasciculata]EGG15373.1 Fumarylacetoacetate hydrolase domain-containing protein [Cavenderia fasciculata]|eukprot:XP_004354115.1 Fumarylacetoacetate hydrolase domain-containing protein [Cavenderia fasciculata]
MPSRFLKLVNMELSNGTKSIGALVENDRKVVDLCALEPNIPRDMKSFLNGGMKLLNLASHTLNQNISTNSIEISQVRVKAPIYDPEKIICIGLNYKEHAIETKMPFPSEPIVFSKYSNCIVGPNDNILAPRSILKDELDYEVELVVVMGREARNVSKEEALEFVAGYTVGNDVSARDWQLKRSGTQWMLGKTFDTFAPIGPAILVNPLMLANNSGACANDFDPNSLNVKCTVNGNVLQNSNTKEFIFNIQEVISHLSKVMTLKPGDIIFTGTPSGVGLGKSPPVYLKNGDIVTCEIENIGQLVNKVKDI